MDGRRRGGSSGLREVCLILRQPGSGGRIDQASAAICDAAGATPASARMRAASR